MDSKTYHIIGMSPGNSYFNEETIHLLLKTVVENFGKAAVLIPDIPAISTYIALGYPENRARRDKAIPKGNALKNRVRAIMSQLNYSDEIVKIIDWENEVENNSLYQEEYIKITNLYEKNLDFQAAVNNASKSVLEGFENILTDIKESSKIAAHYLLSEFAFLEFAVSFFKTDKIIYVYHKNWPVYENYIAGKFDTTPKTNLGFMLLKKKEEPTLKE